MNNWQRHFVNLSQIIGIPAARFTDGKVLGEVADIAAEERGMYPQVSALVIRTGRRRGFSIVPWQAVQAVQEGKRIIIDVPALRDIEAVPRPDGRILLRAAFLDKQIVDVSGSKVVRVNDLHLLREDRNLWVVHVDVGFTGLLRRLGWLNAVAGVSRWLFGYTLKDRLISWKFVQPVTTEKGMGLVSLTQTRARLTELHPADIADIIAELGTGERLAVLTSLDTASAADTLKELPFKMRLATAEKLDPDRLAAIVAEMPLDEAVDLLAYVPRKKLQSLFAALPRDTVGRVQQLLAMPERAAGSIMNTEFISVRASMSAAEVLELVRSATKKKESIYYLYVVDDEERLIGLVSLRKLLASTPGTKVEEIMRRRVVKVRVDSDIPAVARVFSKYDFTVVPVVNHHNRIEGIVTIKDAFEAAFPEVRESREETA